MTHTPHTCTNDCTYATKQATKTSTNYENKLHKYTSNHNNITFLQHCFDLLNNTFEFLNEVITSFNTVSIDSTWYK